MVTVRKQARVKQVHPRDRRYVKPGAACGGTYRCHASQLLPNGPRYCRRFCRSKRPAAEGADDGPPAPAAPAADGAPAATPSGPASAAAYTPERPPGGRLVAVDTDITPNGPAGDVPMGVEAKNGAPMEGMVAGHAAGASRSPAAIAGDATEWFPPPSTSLTAAFDKVA